MMTNTFFPHPGGLFKPPALPVVMTFDFPMWTQQLGELLQQKGISHQVDLWGHDVSHDWAWWRHQLVHHMTQILE